MDLGIVKFDLMAYVDISEDKHTMKITFKHHKYVQTEKIYSHDTETVFTQTYLNLGFLLLDDLHAEKE